MIISTHSVPILGGLLLVGGLGSATAQAESIERPVPHRCLTPYTLDFERQQAGFDAELDWDHPDAPSWRGQEEAINARPTLSGAERTLESGDFVLHYTLEGDDAVTEEQAQVAFESIAYVWNVEHNVLGYPEPPDDGFRGGDDRYDYYFTQQRLTYGVTYAEDWLDDNTATSYIALGSWMGPEEIQVTVAHEHFHAVHFTIDGREETWLYEVTATWMEDQVYDDINDYYNYVPGTMETPDTPLTSTNTMYANSIWGLYMSQRYGQDLIQDIWFGTSADASQEALATASAMGSVYGYDWEDSIHDWREGFVDTSRFEEGSAYGSVTPTGQASFPIYNVSGSVVSTAADVIYIPGNGGSAATDLTVNLSASQSLMAGLILRDSGGNLVSASGGDSQTGQSKVWTVPGFGQSYSEGWLVISNGALSGSDDYALSIEAPGWGGSDGGGCDTGKGGAAGLLGLAFLLLPLGIRRRRS